MSDDKALLAAIWEHPHEDTPRLMYADWLQENGRPERAEFIRAQVELARLQPWEDHSRRAEWLAREAKLWQGYAPRFRRGLAPSVRKDPFHRGFVAPARQPVSDPRHFLKLTDSHFASAPLWHYAFDSTVVRRKRVLSSRGLMRVGRLDLQGGGDAAPALVQSKCLGNLTALDWDCSSLGAEGAAALAAAENMPLLRDLNLHGARPGEEGAAALGAGRLAGQLTRLCIRSNDLTGAAVRALFGPGRFARLESLEVGYEKGGDELLAALAAASLPNLRHLRTLYAKLSAAGAEALANWPGASSLRHVALHYEYGVGPEGVRRLARSPHLRNLLALDVSATNANREEVTALLRERFGEVGPCPNYTSYSLRGGRLPGVEPFKL